MKRIYLDHAASTPVDPKVFEAMKPYFSEKFGNASSLHAFGQEAREAVNEARRVIAKSIGAEPGELVFTSGGTEANNLALKGVAFANEKKSILNKSKCRGHIITTKIEHDCVLNTCKWLARQGFDVTYLDVDREGFISLSQLEKSIRRDTIIVSVIYANNEIGTIQNVAEIGKLCRKHKSYFHTDACQSFTKAPIDVRAMDIDLLTINGHKIYGPKGVGALYVRKGTKIEPWQHGGGHEFGMRSGTENVPAIVGFAAAAQLDPQVEKQRELQKYFIDRVLKEVPHSELNGPQPSQQRLCNNINITFKYIEGEALLTLLDDAGIAVSTASACASHSLEPSHVLLAIGRSHVEAHGSLRISIGKGTTKEDLDYTVEQIRKAVQKLRAISPFGK